MRLSAPFNFRDRCLAYACVQVGVGLVRLKARITGVQHGAGGGNVGRRHPPSPRRSQVQRQNTVEDHVSKKAEGAYVASGEACGKARVGSIVVCR